MNNHRLLTGLLSVALSSGGVCSYGQSVITLEEIFETAETASAQLRPSFTSQSEAEREISVARAGRLPDIDASLSFSYIGDGFYHKTEFKRLSESTYPAFRKRPLTEYNTTGIYRRGSDKCH